MRKALVASLLAFVLAAPALAGEPPKTEAPKKKPKDDLAEFALADGSKVTGKVALKQITIKTAYGKLVVPLGDVVSLRVGRGSDKRAAKEIAELIKKLGSSNFDERQKASDKLLAMGTLALEQLKEAIKSKDAEIKTRAEKLVGEIEKQPPAVDDDEQGAGPLMGEEDELVTKRFTAMGQVEIEKFAVVTRYGKLEVPRDQVIRAIFTQPDETVKILKIESHQTMRSPLRTSIRVKAGDQVKITASGSIRFNNWGRNVGPDGDRNYFGTYYNCNGMSLVYQIGGSNQWKGAGSATSFKATSSGVLTFAINYRSSTGGGSGNWKIKVTVNPK
jgi:hypothetical protein